MQDLQLLPFLSYERKSNRGRKVCKRSMNMRILVGGTFNQPFIRQSYTKIKFSKNKVFGGKTLFCIPSYICFNLEKAVCIKNFFSIVVLSTKK